MSTHCRVCKRLLKNLKSIEEGIGPICRAKGNLQGEFDFMKDENINAIEGFTDVICRRYEGGIETNVPHRIVRHSPDGFEWGYEGSGPAEFALNILSCYVGKEEAYKHHQAFKRRFISPMKEQGGTIKRLDILAWLDDEQKEA